MLKTIEVAQQPIDAGCKPLKIAMPITFVGSARPCISGQTLQASAAASVTSPVGPTVLARDNMFQLVLA